MIDSQDALDHMLADVKRRALGAGDPRAVAAQLLELAESLLVAAGEIEAGDDAEAAVHLIPTMRQRAAQRVYAARRVRDAVFAEPVLFGEPAWDMLLDLLAAQGSRKRISVTSACLASSVPLTTALRWITVLESKGLVVREEDEMDARRTFLKLTRKARSLLRTYFVELERRKLI